MAQCKAALRCWPPYVGSCYVRAGSGVQSGANLCHIFLDQTEARRTEKKIFGVQAPRFAKGLDDRAFPSGSGTAEDCYSVILLCSTYFNYLSFHVWLYSHVFILFFFSVIHQDPRWYQPCCRGKSCINIGKRMQQLPTMLGPAVHRGKEVTHKTL